MSLLTNKALLPDGLRDTLPPDANHEARIVQNLLRMIAARGYERVEPPLVEFEDSLLDGVGRDVELATFRLMDPVSQRMMGVRADMTTQVARIASTRLALVPRPLRLAYAGTVLRVRGDQLQPERQFFEVGAELVGTNRAEADSEIIALASEALMAGGVKDISIDINLPSLVPLVCRSLGLESEVIDRARIALDRKDSAAISHLGGKPAKILGGLLASAGPIDSALYALGNIDFPECARVECVRLETVARQIQEIVPELTLTIDPAENRGFEYHTGLTFTCFSKGVRGSLGRGGRYLAGTQKEPATGFTLFLDRIACAVPHESEVDKIFLPFGTSVLKGRKFRKEGWITVSGLDPDDDALEEAKQLRCTHILVDSEPVKV